jgi:hypothetical protein
MCLNQYQACTSTPRKSPSLFVWFVPQKPHSSPQLSHSSSQKPHTSPQLPHSCVCISLITYADSAPES